MVLTRRYHESIFVFAFEPFAANVALCLKENLRTCKCLLKSKAKSKTRLKHEKQKESKSSFNYILISVMVQAPDIGCLSMAPWTADDIGLLQLFALQLARKTKTRMIKVRATKIRAMKREWTKEKRKEQPKQKTI